MSKQLHSRRELALNVSVLSCAPDARCEAHAIDYLCDALCEDILDVSNDDLLLEVAEDYGDTRALSDAFDEIVKRAEQVRASEVDSEHAIDGQLVYTIQDINPKRSIGRLQRFLEGRTGREPSGVCVGLGFGPSHTGELGRARAYHYKDKLLLGDVLFCAPERREAIRPLFFMVRILFAVQFGFPLQDVIWPAGLLQTEPKVEKEVAEFFMRSLSWQDIECDADLRRLAMATAHGPPLSETGLYCVDISKVRNPRFGKLADEFLSAGSKAESYWIQEPLRQLIMHTSDLLHSA